MVTFGVSLSVSAQVRARVRAKDGVRVTIYIRGYNLTEGRALSVNE